MVSTMDNKIGHQLKGVIKKIYYSLRFSQSNERVKFSVKSIHTGHHYVTYRGVNALKCPFDYVIYQMVISKLSPDLVIEIGTNIGGTTYYIADLLNNLNHGIIHTIDIHDNYDAVLKTHPRIKIYSCGWEKYDIQEAISYSKVLVIEDSSHHYQNTLDVINKFAPIVSVGSYLIIEDGIVSKLGIQHNYEGGPVRAVNQFLKSNKDFIIDRDLCNLFGLNATFNIKGYLRRIR